MRSPARQLARKKVVFNGEKRAHEMWRDMSKKREKRGPRHTPPTGPTCCVHFCTTKFSRRTFLCLKKYFFVFLKKGRRQPPSAKEQGPRERRKKKTKETRRQEVETVGVGSLSSIRTRAAGRRE